MNKSDFIIKVEELRAKSAYKNYEEVRDNVFAMLDNGQASAGKTASAYWRQELAGLEYMFDASPLIVEHLRHHCFHLTGLREYEYRDHHASRSAPKLAKRLLSLKKKDVHGLLVPESPMLGGFGYTIESTLYNVDTLRFYESLLTLDEAGILDQFRKPAKHLTVLEIGAGWGGLAYSFKTLFPNTTYVIVDLPGSILFGATYIKTLFPWARVFVSDGKTTLSSMKDALTYDFIFFPHFMWQDLDFLKADLVMNMASFQEMTTKQVESYIATCAKRGYPFVYSNNRNRSPNNEELSNVSAILGKYYTITTDIEDAKKQQGSALATALGRMRDFTTRKKSRDVIHNYRHIVGTLNR